MRRIIQHSDLPRVEEEIRRDGSQRSQEVESLGRRELASQTPGGRPGRADSHPQRGERKKVVSPSARRRAVKMSVQEGLASGGSVPGAGGLEIEFLSPRAIEPGKPAHPQGGARTQREASSLWLSTHYRADAAGGLRGQRETSSTASERRRNQGEQETRPHEAAGDFDRRAAARRAAGAGLELGLRSW